MVQQAQIQIAAAARLHDNLLLLAVVSVLVVRGSRGAIVVRHVAVREEHLGLLPGALLQGEVLPGGLQELARDLDHLARL